MTEQINPCKNHQWEPEVYATAGLWCVSCHSHDWCKNVYHSVRGEAIAAWNAANPHNDAGPNSSDDKLAQIETHLETAKLALETAAVRQAELDAEVERLTERKRKIRRKVLWQLRAKVNGLRDLSEHQITLKEGALLDVIKIIDAMIEEGKRK